MDLNLIVTDVMTGETTKTAVRLNKEATISELLSAIGAGTAEFPKYYPFSGKLMFGEPRLPFAVSEGRILYEVPFEKAKVCDFISTMDLSNQAIEITVGIPWAGGPGLYDLEQMWESALQVLGTIAVFCSVSGYSLKDFIHWFCKLFQKRKKKPHTVFHIIYSRPMWTHHDLASLLDIGPDRAKDMLKVFGYRYDNSKKIYTQREDIDEIKSKLSDVKSLDIRK